MRGRLGVDGEKVVTDFTQDATPSGPQVQLTLSPLTLQEPAAQFMEHDAAFAVVILRAIPKPEMTKARAIFLRFFLNDVFIRRGPFLN